MKVSLKLNPIDLKAGPFGKIVGESNEDYHANPAVSHSKMRDFRRLPELFYRKHILRVPCLNEEKEDSTSMLRGSMCHADVLEDALAARYIVEPEWGDLRAVDGRTTKEEGKANKDRRDAWRAKLDPNLILVGQDDWDTARAMTEAIRRHPLAAELLSAGEPEVSWRAILPCFSIQCRSDWFNEAGLPISDGEPYVVDIKSVASLCDDDFTNWKKNFEKLGYFRSGPFYSAVIGEVLQRPVRKFFYVVVENREPFGCQVFVPSPASFQQGWSEVLADLKAMTDCHASGKWPGYSQELQVIDLSTFYYKKAGVA